MKRVGIVLLMLTSFLYAQGILEPAKGDSYLYIDNISVKRVESDGESKQKVKVDFRTDWQSIYVNGESNDLEQLIRDTFNTDFILANLKPESDEDTDNDRFDTADQNIKLAEKDIEGARMEPVDFSLLENSFTLEGGQFEGNFGDKKVDFLFLANTGYLSQSSSNSLGNLKKHLEQYRLYLNENAVDYRFGLMEFGGEKGLPNHSYSRANSVDEIYYSTYEDSTTWTGEKIYKDIYFTDLDSRTDNGQYYMLAYDGWITNKNRQKQVIADLGWASQYRGDYKVSGGSNGIYALYKAVEFMKKNTDMNREKVIVMMDILPMLNTDTAYTFYDYDMSFDKYKKQGRSKFEVFALWLNDQLRENNIKIVGSVPLGGNPRDLEGVAEDDKYQEDEVDKKGNSPSDIWDGPSDQPSIHYLALKEYLGENYIEYEASEKPGNSQSYLYEILVDFIGRMSIVQKWSITYVSPLSDVVNAWKKVIFSLGDFKINADDKHMVEVKTIVEKRTNEVGIPDVYMDRYYRLNEDLYRVELKNPSEGEDKWFASNGEFKLISSVAHRNNHTLSDSEELRKLTYYIYDLDGNLLLTIDDNKDIVKNEKEIIDEHILTKEELELVKGADKIRIRVETTMYDSSLKYEEFQFDEKVVEVDFVSPDLRGLVAINESAKRNFEAIRDAYGNNLFEFSSSLDGSGRDDNLVVTELSGESKNSLKVGLGQGVDVKLYFDEENIGVEEFAKITIDGLEINGIDYEKRLIKGKLDTSGATKALLVNDLIDQFGNSIVDRKLVEVEVVAKLTNNKLLKHNDYYNRDFQLGIDRGESLGSILVYEYIDKETDWNLYNKGSKPSALGLGIGRYFYLGSRTSHFDMVASGTESHDGIYNIVGVLSVDSIGQISDFAGTKIDGVEDIAFIDKNIQSKLIIDTINPRIKELEKTKVYFDYEREVIIPHDIEKELLGYGKKGKVGDEFLLVIEDANISKVVAKEKLSKLMNKGTEIDNSILIEVDSFHKAGGNKFRVVAIDMAGNEVDNFVTLTTANRTSNKVDIVGERIYEVVNGQRREFVKAFEFTTSSKYSGASVMGGRALIDKHTNYVENYHGKFERVEGSLGENNISTYTLDQVGYVNKGNLDIVLDNEISHYSTKLFESGQVTRGAGSYRVSFNLSEIRELSGLARVEVVDSIGAKNVSLGRSSLTTLASPVLKATTLLDGNLLVDFALENEDIDIVKIKLRFYDKLGNEGEYWTNISIPKDLTIIGASSKSNTRKGKSLVEVHKGIDIKSSVY